MEINLLNEYSILKGVAYTNSYAKRVIKRQSVQSVPIGNNRYDRYDRRTKKEMQPST